MTAQGTVLQAPAPMSLTSRALLALALMAGFYLLALGLAALLVYIPYAEWRYLHRVHVQIAASCLAGAGLILWAILPRFDRFVPPGPRLSPERCPHLFETIRGIASLTGQRMPAEVYLAPDVNAWVADRGGVLGFGSHRVMGLGLPLLQLLSVAQLRAVLAHEFGHYFGGDTRLGPWVYKTRAAIGRTLQSLQDSALQKPFIAYGKLFLRLTHAVSRRQEFAADRLAAVKVGARPLIDGLKAVHGAAPAFDGYWRGEVAPLLYQGFRPPIAEGFTRFINAEPISRSVQAYVERELAQSEADPYDTHPALCDRIAAIRDLGETEPERDERRATSLLGDVGELELGLLESLTVQANKLHQVGWDEVGAAVYLPMWQRAASKHVSALAGLTPRAFPEIAAALARFVERFEPEAGAEITEEEKQHRAVFLLGAAFTIALIKRGWGAHVQPGEPVRVEQAGFVVRPFEAIGELTSGSLSGEAWQTLCTDAGIADLQLDDLGDSGNG